MHSINNIQFRQVHSHIYMHTWTHTIIMWFCNLSQGQDVRPTSPTCNFIARFCRVTLSRDKIASVTWRVAQGRNFSTVAQILFRLEQRSILHVKLCRENAVNGDWSILVYATKLQCATRHVTLAMLSREKVARQTRAIKSQMWHRS